MNIVVSTSSDDITHHNDVIVQSETEIVVNLTISLLFINM